MFTTENYVCKKEVDWSVLIEGLTLPVDNQVIFGQIMGRFLKKGESKEIKLYLYGKTYKAKITNVNFSSKFKRKSDILQIRYPRNGELSRALQVHFSYSFNYIKEVRENRDASDRSIVRVDEENKEYLVIYTTEYDDTYVLETIEAKDIKLLRDTIKDKDECVFEEGINYNVTDEKSNLEYKEQIVKVRKLNRKIGDNLKLLYGYRCQICGQLIGEEYGTHVVEAHHIDYFVMSLNNDSSNQIIVCPNHHKIIHKVNPSFDRKRKIYIYDNGYKENLILNKHL